LMDIPSPQEGRWLKANAAGAAPNAAEFLYVLSQVDGLWIRGSAAARQSARLDNVAILDARRLTIAHTDEGFLLVQWPVGRFNYQLLSSQALPSATWSTNFPITRHGTNKGIHQVRLPAGPGTRFFELMKTP
jgi:hypothetical protein